jgi:hypothetical protein
LKASSRTQQGNICIGLLRELLASLACSPYLCTAVRAA